LWRGKLKETFAVNVDAESKGKDVAVLDLNNLIYTDVMRGHSVYLPFTQALPQLPKTLKSKKTLVVIFNLRIARP
jgi:hypothetical protein